MSVCGFSGLAWTHLDWSRWRIHKACLINQIKQESIKQRRCWQGAEPAMNSCGSAAPWDLQQHDTHRRRGSGTPGHNRTLTAAASSPPPPVALRGIVPCPVACGRGNGDGWRLAPSRRQTDGLLPKCPPASPHQSPRDSLPERSPGWGRALSGVSVDIRALETGNTCKNDGGVRSGFLWNVGRSWRIKQTWSWNHQEVGDPERVCQEVILGGVAVALVLSSLHGRRAAPSSCREAQSLYAPTTDTQPC